MRVPTLPATRIVRGASGAELSHQFVDSDGEPAAPSGTVTVAVTRSDGSTVTPGAVAGSSTDPRTVLLAVADVAEVDWLTAVWSDDGTEVFTDTVEVVGGVIMSLATAKSLDPTLAAKEEAFPRARRAVEDMVTAELGRSLVERFYTERISGTGTNCVVTSWPDVLEVKWAKIWTSATESTSLTAAELAAIPSNTAGILERTDGSVWPSGTVNIEVGYRFGMLDLPTDLRDNLVLAVRHHLVKLTNGVPYQSETIRTADGILMSLARPGVGNSITGNDDVDAAIRRHGFMQFGIA